MPRPQHRALSLVEVLVAAGLGIALLTLLVQVLVPMMKAAQKGSVQIALQQTGLVVLDRIAHDTQRSVWAGLAQSSAPNQELLGIHRLDQINASGQQTFEDALVIYVWQPPRVTRRVVVPTSGDGFKLEAPFQPGAGRLSSLALSDPARESRIVGGDVKQLKLVLEEPTSTLAMRVTVKADEETLDLERTISLRNETL